MEFLILGPVEAYANGHAVALRGDKQRALLAVLLVHANKVVSGEQLIDALWGESLPTNARNALQAHVSQLRRVLDAAGGAPASGELLVTRPRGYRLELPPERLDAARFELLLAQGRRALQGGEAERAAELLRAGLGLWRGPALADVALEAFAQVHAARLEELRLEATETRIAADLQLGRHAELVGELETLTQAEPLREGLRAQLMLALYRSGRQAEALEVYRATRRRLVDELGIEPSASLRQLHSAILDQDPALQPGGSAESASPRAQHSAEHATSRGFVGRERELRELLAALDAASTGGGGLVLLGGEAGIGKSRLVRELAWLARARGVRPEWGRCWEESGAPPYAPWTQILRALLLDDTALSIAEGWRRDVTVLAQLVPELREATVEVPDPPGVHPDAARLRMFDAVARVIRAAAAKQPLLLVVDDIVTADVPSLLMLRYVAGELPDARALVVATYRDTDLASHPAAAAALAELTREPATRRLSLSGLSAPETAQLVELCCGAAAPEAVSAAVHEKTEGNPLFVSELVRLLAAEGRLAVLASERGAPLRLPPGIRQAIAVRTARLSEPCQRVLAIASALGREFAIEPLALVSGVDAGSLAELLDQALAAGILVEATPPGSLRFSHALVADTLYDGLSPARRARVHAAIAAALQEVYGEHVDAHLAELAHHYARAGATAPAGRSVEYAQRAAQYADAMLAYEDSARLYTLALDCIAAQAPGDAERRLEILLGLGDAQSKAGDLGDAKSTFRQAAELARMIGRAEELAQAALGYGGRGIWSAARGDPHVVPLLDEALRALRDAEVPQRARVMARLATAMRDSASGHACAALAREAVELARRVDDPRTLTYTLDALYVVLWRPDTLQERLAVATEAVQLAAETGDVERELPAHDYRLFAFLERGEMAAVEAEFDAVTRLAEGVRQPWALWKTTAVGALLALLQGRFDEAAELIASARGHGERSQPWNATVSYRLQRFALASARGGLQDIEPLVARAIEEFPSYRLWRCVAVNLDWQLGRLDRAGAGFERLAASDFRDLPFDEEWLLGLSLLAPVCAALDDAQRARTLHAMLAPYADRVATGIPEIATGAVARPLGLLAATRGDSHTAERHFEDALKLNTAIGARPWLAHTQHDHARMLLARHDTGDRERAHELLAQCRRLYAELGMQPWLRSLAPSRQRLGGS